MIGRLRVYEQGWPRDRRLALRESAKREFAMSFCVRKREGTEIGVKRGCVFTKFKRSLNDLAGFDLV
uniref:Uncharacterized protein n=1 Tax=Daucus carota subsp. sativus TaxID=79200 RepID=A0A166F8V3_DAUCS